MVDSRIALVIHPSLHFPNAQIGITVVRLSLLTRVHAAPWAKATKNEKKPQNQTCESCRKDLIKIFA